MQSKLRRLMTVGAAALTVASFGISNAGAAATASDNASDPAYASGFNDGTNGGTGFEPWIITATGTGGTYISGSTNDNTGVLTPPVFDIWNDTNDGAGGGTLNVDVTTATRPFSGGALSPDQVFKFSDVLHYANQTQGGGSALGWSLEDSDDDALFDFHTAGGAPGYYLTDENNVETVEETVPYNYDVADTFAFELNDDTGDYTLTVTSAPSGNVTGGIQTFTGQISMATGGPSEFAIYNNNGEGGSDIQFNNLAITSATAPQQWISPSSGDWNALSNWNGLVPNAVGAEADFYGAITSNQTVYTNQAVTVGTVNFNNAYTYEITGTGSLTLQASSGDAEVIVQQGTQEIDLPTTIASNTIFNVASGATLLVANPVTIESGETLSQSGTGTVTYQSIVTVDSDAEIEFANSTHAHELSLASGAIASVGGSASTVLEVDSLANSGTLNLHNNTLIVNYRSSADPAATIRAYLAAGYNGGAWNGTSATSGVIVTSAPITIGAGTYSIGYADGADGVVAGLPSGEIEVAYTLAGDANLDGKVDSADFGILADNYGASGAVWDEGDFNYDGKVDSADFGILAVNYGQSAGGNAETVVTAADWSALDAFAAANGITLSAVPEPASAGLLLACGIGMIARRRRATR